MITRARWWSCPCPWKCSTIHRRGRWRTWGRMAACHWGPGTRNQEEEWRRKTKGKEWLSNWAPTGKPGFKEQAAVCFACFVSRSKRKQEKNHFQCQYRSVTDLGHINVEHFAWALFPFGTPWHSHTHTQQLLFVGSFLGWLGVPNPGWSQES